MRLSDLEGELLAITEIRPGGGCSFQHVSTLAEASGVMFICPACGDHSVCVLFEGTPAAADGGAAPRWRAAGSTIDDLSITPSIRLLTGCQWHGFVTDGGIRFA